MDPGARPARSRASSPDMEGFVKVSETEAMGAAWGSCGRGGNQARLATVITLICAGQHACRCRMTVSRPPSWPRTGDVGCNHKGFSRILGNSVCPTHARSCHTPAPHAAGVPSATNAPTAHTKPASSRATATIALCGPSRPLRCRYRACKRSCARQANSTTGCGTCF